ncbi:hypothetical protein T08_11531 [Trichinella sp. T8]|uniref:Uncharacterized protein n=1 Tax=Trichinella murrelli TaxID=144512 RepID=A0A0V0TUE9_9BILA|nr:hypothetical protein T05_12619 [Trichinella murrelli]KRZ85407.1 hypothetical protein T08_11531 [Trichinella sp. T8]
MEWKERTATLLCRRSFLSVLSITAISVKRRCVKVDGHETTPTQCLTLLLYRSARMDGSGVAAKRTDEFAERLPACLLLNRSIT